MDLLLAADEPAAVEVLSNCDGRFVIVCEHASNRIPRSLGGLGLKASDLDRHIAWDPGAVSVAEGISARLDSALIVQRYSRLVVDCNRDPGLPDAIATFSEDTTIPGNVGLLNAAKQSRINDIWRPFHEALEGLLTARREVRRATALVTVHSFTPVYRGVPRPWHVGIISTDERSLADSMLKELRREAGLIVGDNEPYSAKDNVDYTIRRHGRDRGLPHVMIEIRNDLLTTAVGQEEWATRLARLLGALDVAALAA